MSGIFYRRVIAATVLCSCLPTNNQTRTRGVNPALDLGRSRNLRDIVLFYANETPDTPLMRNYYARIDAAVNSLKQSDPNPVYDKIKAGYQHDIGMFTPQVRKDVAGLKKVICETKAFANSGLFIFTNELARDGKFEYCLPGDKQLYTGALKLQIPATHKDDFRYTQSPLALPSSLEAARNAIKDALDTREMPLSDQRFIWISKSHGSADLLMTPKLLHRLDQWSDTDLKAHFKSVAGQTSFKDIHIAGLRVGTSTLGEQKLGMRMVKDLKVGDLKVGDLKMSDLKLGDLKVGDLKVGDLKVGDLKLGDLKEGDLKLGDLKEGDLKLSDLKLGDLKEGDLKLGDLKIGDLKVGDLKEGDLKEGDLASDENPSDTDALGISKTFFVETIKKVNLSFPVVFFESCSSELPASLVMALKSSAEASKNESRIGRIYTSDRGGLKFETVDYSQLNPVDAELSFGAALQQALDNATTH